MGRGVKWYSSKRKKEIGGTVVGSQGEYALVRLNKENPTHEPALVKVPARHIEVVSSKATLSDPNEPKSNLETPEFEEPEAVGRKQSNAYVKPSDSPEDYSISETPDGNTYISRKDGAQLYFPARSLDVGDELIAPDGADETKPFSMGKAWAKKGAERLNTAGPKTGKVVAIEGDRYAIVQLPEGHTVEDKKNPGQQTDKVTVGLSNSVIKLTPGLKTALGNKLEENFSDTSQEDGGEEEIDPNSPDAQSDHIGREVTDEQLAEEDDAEDLQDEVAPVEDEDAPIVDEVDPAEKAAAEADLARRVAEREEARKALGDQYDENGLTDDEKKMITAYERMANRAADKFDDDGAAKFFAKAEDLRAIGKRRLGATKEEAADEVKAESAPQTPEKAPESAPEPEKAPEVTPEAAKPAEANVPLAELEQQAKAEGDLVLYHGGLPEGTTLDGIDLNRSGTQQNKRGATYGGFYLTDESSKKWSEDYAEKRNGVMHGFAIDKNARIDDRGTQQIDRISAEARAIAAEKSDIIKGKDLLGRTQYVILNKDVVKGVGETNIKQDTAPEPATPKLVEPTAPELPPLVEGEELELPIPGIKKQGKRTDKSAQHLKTLNGLEEGDRVSYTNAHDETSTYQKHPDGTWDLLDPEDEWEDQSPLEEALTAEQVAQRHKRGDLVVETAEDREEAERAANRAANENRKKYEPIPTKPIDKNEKQVPTRAEQDQQEANLADKPWSAEDIASNMREWFDFAQAVKDGDNRAIETMANNKRAGDEETFIAVNDKGQPFDVTLTYNGLGDPVVRISNFENSNEDYGDFEIDASVMPKQLSTLIRESINADDVAAAIAERNGSNDVEETDFAPILTRYAGYGKADLTKATKDNPDAGIEVNGNNADVTDLDKAQDFLRDLVAEMHGKIGDPNTSKGAKISLNRSVRDINALLSDVNNAQFERDGKIRPHKSVRDEPVAEAPEPEAIPEPEEIVPEAPAPEAASGPKEWSRGFVTMQEAGFDALPVGTTIGSLGTYAKAYIDGVEHRAVHAKKTEKGWEASTAIVNSDGKLVSSDETVLFPTDAFGSQGYVVRRVPAGALDSAPWERFDGNMDALEPGDYVKLKNGKQGVFVVRKNGKPAFAVDDPTDVPKISSISGANAVMSVSKASSRNSQSNDTVDEAPAPEAIPEPEAVDPEFKAAEDRYNKFVDEAQNFPPSDPRRAAWDSAMDSGHQATLEGIERFSKEWYDTVNSSYTSNLNDLEAEAAAEARAAEEADTVEAPEPATEGPKSDISDWKNSLDQITEATADPKYKEAGNWITAAIQDLNGLSGEPNVVASREEFDALPGKKLFRGVGSQEDADKFMSGPNWVGVGGSGSGIYTSTNKFRGESFKRADGGALLEMKLPDDAKIMDATALDEERKRDLEKAIADDDVVGQFLAEGDLGRYASARGLDGYSLKPFDAYSDDEEFVVLTNRNAVSVLGEPVESAEDVPEVAEDAPDSPDSPEAPALNDRGLTEAEEAEWEQHEIDADVEARAGDSDGVQMYKDKADEILKRGQDRLNGVESIPEEAEPVETPEEVSDTVEETAPVAESDWVNPLDALDIVRRQPMAIDGETYPPTQQQQDVIDAVLAGLDTKVQAMAGTGKTSTLVALSRRIKEHGKQAIYIAFNKTVQTEAEERMEGLPVESKTGHGVAYQWALKKAPYLITRLNGQDPSRPIKFNKKGEPTAWADKWSHTSAHSIASDLGIKNGDVKDEAGQNLTYQTTVLAVRKTVEKYALSDKDDITAEHVPDDFEIHEDSKEEIVRLAKEYWKDLESENGNFRVTHDVYRKFWALSRPDLTDGTGGNKKGANILYIDEAQDTPPVLAKVVADQKMQKVIVGDPNQAIYAFAENIDYLSEADGDVELPLNKSWRFGPQVADIGNRFLEFLGSEDRVIGGGGDSQIVYGMEDADAVLVRTNAGMLDAILDEVSRDRRVTAPDGTRADLDKLIRSVEALKEGEPLDYPHDDLIGFKNWGEVLSAHHNGDKSVSKIVKLFEVTDKYTLARAEPGDIERMTREKMEKAKKAVQHLVQYIPKFETLKIEEEKVGDGTRTWVSAVDVHPDPTKKWTADDKYWATKSFSTEMGKILAPHAFDKKLNWAEQNAAYQRAGGLETIGFEYDRRTKRMFTDDPEAAALLKSFSGEADVTISTAHKSKGLEWDRVRIGDDFFVPYEDKDGNMVYPEDPAEYKLGYVAVTRAAKELDPGVLGWIYEQTSENGGTPGKKKAPEAVEAPEAAEESVPEVSAPEDTTPTPEQVTEEAPIETTPDTEESLDEVADSLYDDDGLTPTEAARVAELDQQMADIYSGKSDADLTPVENEWNDILEHGERRKKGEDLPEYEKPADVVEEPEVAPEPVVEEAPAPVPSADRPFSEYSSAEIADFPVGTKVWKGFAAYGGKQGRGYFEKTGTNEWADYRGGDLFKQNYVVDDSTVQFGQDNDPRMAPTFPEASPEPTPAPEVAPAPEVVPAPEVAPEPEYDAEGLTPEERRRADQLEQAIYDAYRARKPETAKHLDTELNEILQRGADRLKPKKKPAPAPVAEAETEATDKPKRRERRDFSDVPVHDANGTQIKVGDTIGHKRLGPVVITGFMPAAGRVTYIDPSTNKVASVKGSAVSIISEDVAEVPEAVVRTGEPGERFTDLTTGKQGFYGANGEPIIVGQRVTTKDGRSGLVKSVYTAKSGVAWIPVQWDDSGEIKRVYGNLLSLEGGPSGGNGGGGSPEPEAPEPTAPEAPEEPAAPSVPETAPALSIKDSVENYSGTEGFASSYDSETFAGNPLSASGIRRFEERVEDFTELRRDLVTQYEKGADGSVLTHGVKTWNAKTGEYVGLVKSVEVYDDDISIRVMKTNAQYEAEKDRPGYDPDYHSRSAVFDPKELISKPPTLWDGSFVDFSTASSVSEINATLFQHYPSVHFNISENLQLAQAKLLAKAISANFRKFPMLENSMNEVTTVDLKDGSVASLASFDPEVAVFSDQSLNIIPYSAADFKQVVNDGRGSWFNDVPNGKQADYIITHEMGHALDGLTGWIGSARVYELLREYLAEQGITGLSNADLAKYLVDNKMISEYSAEMWKQGVDPEEMVAEAFADVEINGINAKPVNKMIHRELMSRLDAMQEGGRSETTSAAPESDRIQSFALANAMQESFTAGGFNFKGSLPGGNSGAVLMTGNLSDGTEVVMKTENNVESVDKEFLAARALNALGVDNIGTVRIAEGTTMTNFIDGVTGMEWLNEYTGPISESGKAMVGLKNGREVGLFDFITSNQDRHLGNWLYADGAVAPIDHGGTQYRAWNPAGDGRYLFAEGPFAKNSLGVTVDFDTYITSVDASVSWTREELADVRRKIEALASDYAAHPEWHQFMLDRLDYLLEETPWL
jgi:hypothetical protein